MKKRFLALITVMLLAFVMTAAVSAAVPSIVLDSSADVSALEEGDTFDAYIIMSPMAKIGTSKNYIGRVPEDTVTAAPTASNGKLSKENFVVTWDKTSLEVSNVVTYKGSPSNTLQSAGDGMYFAFLGVTNASKVEPSVSAYGTGTNNAGNLVITYDVGTGNKAGGFIVRNYGTTAPSAGVVAKITFKVVAGATGGENLSIKLNNTYTVDDKNKTSAESKFTVTVLAGCAHENKVALDANALAAAGLENSESTCLKEGVTWYYCPDCDSNTSVTSNRLDHEYTEEGYTKEPSCISKGYKANFCLLDPDCTAHDAEVEVPALGHEYLDENHVYLAPGCDTDGYEFYVCTRCHGLSTNKTDYIATTYIGGVFSGDGSVPEKVKLAATGHDWVFDRTEGDINYYKCTRECGVADMQISLNDTVRYVSNDGTGDGLTVDTPTTLSNAYDAFKDLPEEIECKIYLVGTVTLPNRQVSSQNTVAKSFEETQHDAHITITTAPGKSKATLEFPFDTTSMFFLYGPTTFDNIKVSSTKPGTSSSSSASINIFARGFEITMTENFETVNNGTAITYEKKDGSFAKATSMSLKIPNCKLYLLGGFYPNGGYDGANTTTFETTMNVYGGTYWVVVGASRAENANVKNCVINMNIGGKAKIGQLLPISTATGANVEGTVVNMHYYKGFEAVLIYRAQNANTVGNYTVNYFFHNGTGSLKIGEFMMAQAHPKNVNCYYTTTDAEATAMAQAFMDKGSIYKLSYQETQENLPFYAWCVVHGGGHTIGDDGVCTFCGTVPKACTSHSLETVVLSKPTCKVPGESYKRCTVCYETIGDIIYTEDAEAHDIQMNVNTTPYTISCTICGKNVGTYSGENTGVFYVSDNGYGDGGFSPEYPLNNFDTAMKLAAKYNGEATVYIIDTITVNSNVVEPANQSVYAEPAHTNHITVKGYSNIGVIKRTIDKGGNIVYGLKGDTTFENVEFSSTTGNAIFRLVANHNHLTLGENVTADFLRNVAGGTNHGGSIMVIGGCYNTYFSSGCTKKDTHVTLCSGLYYEIICGSVSQECGLKNGTINIEILGDILIRDYFVAGSYKKDAGDVNLTIDGNIASGNLFAFSGYNDSSNRTIGKVSDVTIKLLGGTISSNNFQASQGSSLLRPLGAPPTIHDANATKYDVTALLDSLTICYDPAISSVRETFNHVYACAISGSDSAIDKINVKTIGDTYCEVSANGEHVAGNVAETVGSTCAKQGYTIYVCDECGEEYTVPGEIVEHTFGSAEVASAANCINPEILKEVCGECGFIVYTIGSTAATGVHDFGEDGDVCIYCTQSRQDLCEHVWDDGVEVSTGCGTGYEYTCINGCGKTKTEITGASHNYGKYTVTVQPTETEPGVKTRKCKSCGMVETALIYADGGAMNGTAIAVDANGSLADVDIALSKLTKAEREVVNALLQDTAYGSEIKVSYDVDGNVTGVTYSIPLPAEYADMQNVQVIVKDDEGKLHVVEFTVEKGYIVFTF